MGFRNGKIIKYEGFETLELNEMNAQAIFNRCGKVNEDGSTEWNKEARKKNKANIRYLMGQLALVHERVEEHELDDAFFKRYDGKDWTTDGHLLINLLNMGDSSHFYSLFDDLHNIGGRGDRSHFCSFFEKDGKSYVKLNLDNLKPVLSPKDPGFSEWWEHVDGLMVRAEAAYEEEKYEEALSCYQKAAAQGCAEAEYELGGMYELGKGTELDDIRAIEWYQKALSHSYEVAKDGVKRCQIRYDALRGDAEAQYEYAETAFLGKKERLEFYTKSAVQGYADAQYKVGCWYAFGKETNKDSQEALKWFQKAAKQGHEYSKIFAGLLCKKGLLRSKVIDPEEAIAEMINRYGSLSSTERKFISDIFAYLPRNLQADVLDKQADMIEKLIQ